MNTNLLRPAPVSSRQFHYNANTHTFTAEASDTHGFGQVYNDACDEGLTIVSARTGTEVVFVIDSEHRNNDGDLTYWTLRPATTRTAPANIASLRVVLFND